jgi:hypothetical protein
MASNKFSKKFDTKEEPSTGHAPTGKNSPPPGRGERSGKGNPFARKFDGNKGLKKKGKRKPPPKRKGKLQKFGQRY